MGRDRHVPVILVVDDRNEFAAVLEAGYGVLGVDSIPNGVDSVARVSGEDDTDGSVTWRNLERLDVGAPSGRSLGALVAASFHDDLASIAPIERPQVPSRVDRGHPIG
ncbi:hypothetical protein GWG54_01600 [Natronococcus sp. JC468]|uniref:hypothetical protein n=1 Tax=Natronococcus sp. JC468 TaxID=1961921 RepID=UPI00143C9835|nr:hypothetical protein [Natronococcus sp. JC468]NKE34527.1 hypothetical protein [Natronococcus sp. JC468]